MREVIVAGEIRIDRAWRGARQGFVATITVGPKPGAWAVSVMEDEGGKPGATSISVTLSDGVLNLCTLTPQRAAERWQAMRAGLLEGPSGEAVAAELARAAAAVKACALDAPAIVRFALLVALQVDPRTAASWSRMKRRGRHERPRRPGQLAPQGDEEPDRDPDLPRPGG